jgi:hypothetical protein
MLKRSKTFQAGMRPVEFSFDMDNCLLLLTKNIEHN